MVNEKYTERLARLVFWTAIICLTGFAVWYFSSVVAYIAISGVIALIAKQIMTPMRKIRVFKRHIPDWTLALFTMLLIMGVFCFVFLEIVPVLGKTLSELSSIDLKSVADYLGSSMNNINLWAKNNIPGIDSDFEIQALTAKWFKDFANFQLLSDITGSLANFMIDFGIGLFCVIFISFFLIKDSTLLSDSVTAVVPEKYETRTREAIADIEHLLSRYFGGIFIEVSAITLMNFTWLHFIAGIRTDASLTMAAITGILNIIPYIGPLAGGIIGTIIGIITKIIYSTATFPEMSIGGFTFLLIAIFTGTHLVDVFLFQPFIYSSSIRANALEIFIVILLAGTIGGPVGMLVAIPAYTVIRVIALKFFGDRKAIRKLLK